MLVLDKTITTTKTKVVTPKKNSMIPLFVGGLLALGATQLLTRDSEPPTTKEASQLLLTDTTINGVQFLRSQTVFGTNSYTIPIIMPDGTTCYLTMYPYRAELTLPNEMISYWTEIVDYFSPYLSNDLFNNTIDFFLKSNIYLKSIYKDSNLDRLYLYFDNFTLEIENKACTFKGKEEFQSINLFDFLITLFKKGYINSLHYFIPINNCFPIHKLEEKTIITIFKNQEILKDE